MYERIEKIVNVLHSVKLSELSSLKQEKIINECKNIANNLSIQAADFRKSLSYFSQIAHLAKNESISLLETLDENNLIVHFQKEISDICEAIIYLDSETIIRILLDNIEKHKNNVPE